MLDGTSTDNSGRVRKVYTIGVDGSELRKIAEVSLWSQPGGSLSWSPDGTEILFTMAKDIRLPQERYTSPGRTVRGFEGWERGITHPGPQTAPE